MNDSAPEPAQLLREALADAGLLLSWTDYRAALNRVEDQGSMAVEALSVVFESEIWRLANNSLPRPYAAGDLRRILGFGRWTTEFLGAYAGWNGSEQGQQRVLTAGGLANFIVAAYDQFMEDGDGNDILPDGALARLQNAPHHPTHPHTAGIAAARRWVIEWLVHEYFRTLRSAVTDGNRGLYLLLHRCINTMQAAERRTFAANVSLDRRSWSRKSALPFVTMGLPVWLEGSEAAGSAVRGHMRWMYRVGRVFGLVDDFVDYPHDARYSIKSSLTGLAAGALASVAGDVANQGSRLLAQWRARAGSTESVACGPVFGALLASWLGS